jgi:hypothetical protein
MNQVEAFAFAWLDVATAIGTLFFGLLSWLRIRKPPSALPTFHIRKNGNSVVINH